MRAMDDFDKKWQRIADLLSAEAAGESKPRITSTRTLFGIKSSVEELVDRTAREHDQALKAALRRGQMGEAAAAEPDEAERPETLEEPGNPEEPDEPACSDEGRVDAGCRRNHQKEGS